MALAIGCVIQGERDVWWSMKESNLSHVRPIYYYATVLQTAIGNIDQIYLSG